MIGIRQVEIVIGITGKDNQQCSIFKPDNLLQGCINAVTETATNPGSATASTLFIGGAMYQGFKQGNPALAAAEALGLEIGLTCLAGTVNTAVSNYQTTCMGSDSTSSGDNSRWCYL